MGNDKQNVSLRHLFNVALLTVRGALRGRLQLSDGAFPPKTSSTFLTPPPPVFKVIRPDQKRLDQFSVLFLPPQRLPWLSAKSILSLVGDNERVSPGLQMNTVALGLLQLRLRRSRISADTFGGRQEKRNRGLQRPIKNTYSN